MRAVRVAVVSDSHLSERTPEAVANWRAVVDDLAGDPPDAVVHAGDISADGASRPGDLALARRELDRLGEVGAVGAGVLAVPGNHDVGESPGAPPEYPVVDTERRARYRDVMGPDRWAVDVGGWRLVGMDALVLGSGLDDEEEDQWSWLADALGGDPGPGPVALFLHKPLAEPPGHTGAANLHRYVSPPSRARLANVVAGAGSPVRVVVSGHVHQYRRHPLDGVPHVWAPTTWAVLPDRVQPVIGAKTCGLVELSLRADGTVDAGFRRPPGLAQLVLGDDVPDPYDAAH